MSDYWAYYTHTGRLRVIPSQNGLIPKAKASLNVLWVFEPIMFSSKADAEKHFSLELEIMLEKQKSIPKIKLL